MTDLTLVSMEEIREEINRRHDAVALITRKLVARPDLKDEVEYHFKDKTACLGLMAIASFNLKLDYKEDTNAQGGIL